MKFLLAHPGTQHAYRLARELQSRGLLQEFWTGLALGEGGLAARLAAHTRRWPLLGGLANRIVRGVPPERVRTVAGNEIRALYGLKRGQESLGVIHERNRRFQESIPDASILAGAGVIGFDTSAWLLAERAARLDRPLWLDRTIGHPDYFSRVQTELHRQFPTWAPLPVPRPAQVVAAEAAEHALAHRIVVGSAFARDTLAEAGVPAEKIRLNPYGVDWTRFAGVPRPVGAGARKLRFLFVGSLQARKGVPHLLAAWRQLAPADAELWLAGGSGPRESALISPLPGLKLLGQVPHADMPALLASADVFVLPSLFEGFSLAMLEALASGLPIIATPNTGAAEFLPQPDLGMLIRPGSVEELADALRHFIQQRPDRPRVLAAAAPLAAHYSWQAYGDRWAAMLAT